MIPRPSALFANIVACMSALRVLRVTLRSLAAATPGVFNIVALFVVQELRGLRCVHWRVRLPALGGPRATRG